MNDEAADKVIELLERIEKILINVDSNLSDWTRQ